MPDQNIDMARRIAEAVAEAGGTAYYIGGYVRDRLRHKENKDIDIEVHGVTPAQLEAILDGLGERIAIGESFGIYHLKGYDLDIAMPRKEENRGKGHKDFAIFVDPFAGTMKAAQRRDFTINALMENVLTGELTDHFGGVEDLKKEVIRHVNDKSFTEDPLRVLRAAQFAARFGYTVAPETLALCRTMDLTSLPRERVMGELGKALLKAEKPSIFFESLRQMDQLGVWFPELAQTIGVQQSRHHAEGDVWTHTMMVTDAAARFRDQLGEPLGFMLSALAHDFGKSLCTEFTNGDWHAYGHESLGLPLAERFMTRLTAEKSLIEYVLNLTALHMEPHTLAWNQASVEATNRMFDRAADPEALLCLALADSLGMISPDGTVSHEDYLRRRLAAYRDIMSRPYVMGRDLIAAGLSPSEHFSDYLACAHRLRLAGVPKEEALREVLAMAEEK